MQSRTLLRVDLSTGAQRVIASDVGRRGPDINAIGYNARDGYLYGAQGYKLLRIGAGNATETVAWLPVAPNMGDVDANGQYFFSKDGTAWGQVDLGPASPRYGQLVAHGRARPPSGARALADWTFTPADPGHAYSVAAKRDGSSALVRWSTSSHKWETVPGYGAMRLRAKLFGAVVATADGVVYAVDRDSGRVFRFPIRDPHSVSRAGRGLRRGINDGARCALKPDAAA